MVYAQKKMRIGVFVNPEMELQDFAGPTDVFVKANRFTDDQYEILLFSEDGMPIHTERNIVNLIPRFSMMDLPKVDMLLLPGAPIEVAKVLSMKDGVINFLTFQKQNGTVLASVCTGVFFLANAGLLNGHRFTTHYLDAVALGNSFPQATMVSNVRFVDSGQILTASGITSGIDLALYIVEKHSGKNIQQQVSMIMQYDYIKYVQWPK